MRLHLLLTAIAAVLVTLHAPIALAKENDRLAQKLVVTDEGATPPGGTSGGDSGGADESVDIADGEPLRFDEVDPGYVSGGGDETDPPEVLASLDWESFARNTPDRVGCYGACAVLNGFACFGSVSGALTSWSQLGTTTVPWLLAAGATCGALVTGACGAAYDKVFQ